MRQNRFSQILGVSVALSLLVASIVVSYSLIKHAIARQTPNFFCLTHSAPPLCYSNAAILSPEPTTALAIQPNGNLLASSKREAIELWDLSRRQRVRLLRGHTNWITTLAFSPDGKTLASGSLDGTIRLWNLAGERVANFNAGSVTVLAFSPAGTTIASGSRLVTPDRTARPIQLWNVATGQLATGLNAAEPTTALAFSPDGRRLATGTTTTRVWDLTAQTVIQQLDSGDLNALIFSRDGQLLLTGSDGVKGEDGIKLWDRAGNLVRVLDSVAADFALSPNGEKLITTYGGTANFWRMQPFGYLGTLRGSTYSGLLAEFGLNGRAIVTGSSDGVKVWDLKEQE